MRNLIRRILMQPVRRLVTWFSSDPDRERVFAALTRLRNKLAVSEDPASILPLDQSYGKYILFSDHHKGARNGADDFAQCERNYLSALDFYDGERFHLIALGDAEELWENTIAQIRRHNQTAFAAERRFLIRGAFTKIYGNHDLEWMFNPLAKAELRTIYGQPVAIREGVILRTLVGNRTIDILCTHGHQGDAQSDGNLLSKFFVSALWAPLQAFLHINPNTPAYNTSLKTVHNRLMYEWSSAEKNTLLVTGHTHQPVFESLTHHERILRTSQALPPLLPGYFNTGCCCFNDGDITGLEIAGGEMRLVKWTWQQDQSQRVVLESASITSIAQRLST